MSSMVHSSPYGQTRTSGSTQMRMLSLIFLGFAVVFGLMAVFEWPLPELRVPFALGFALGIAGFLFLLVASLGESKARDEGPKFEPPARGH